MNSFINTQLATSQTEDDSNTLNRYFGLDIRHTLEKIEQDLKGIALEIVIEPKETPKNEQEPTPSIEIKFFTEGEKHIKAESDDIIGVLDRIEYLQNNYNTLLDKVTSKINELKEQYSSKDYDISIVKRRICPEPKSAASSHRSSPTTDVLPNKRKTSFNSDSDNDQPNQRRCYQEFPKLVDPFSEVLIIGPNGTQMYRKNYEAMQWKDAAGGTRELCNLIFGERVLATHSLTGNQSPAFRGRERPVKGQLDPKKTADIIYLICSKFNVSQQVVRATITTKCADATKKIKRLAAKRPLI